MSTKPEHDRPQRPTATGIRHMVAAGHPLSTQAGFQILEAGGNAVDAGIAVAIATNVLQPDLTGFAGIAPMVIYEAERDEIVTVIGSGYWPKLASCQFFQDNHGGAIPLGILESHVPGAPDAYVRALTHYGTMSYGEVAAAAIGFARNGFTMYHLLAQLIGEKPMPWPTTQAALRPGGRVPVVGELFCQPDMAATLQWLADEEKAAAAKGGREAGLQAVRDSFYKGDFACTVDTFYKEQDGLVRYEDMANYEGGLRPSVTTRFQGLDIHAMSPDSIHFLEALNILGGFDLAAMGHNTPAFIHTVTEAFKLAFADREAYVGDTDFVDVPVDVMISPEYADARRARIDPGKAYPDIPPPGDVGCGTPAAVAAAAGPGDAQALNRADAGTSYCCAVDRHGNGFSCMISGGNANAPVVPGTGMGLAHFGIASRADPEHPNSVEPGKRMRAGGPAIAVKPGEYIMPFGTPGSDVIPQAMAQVLCNMVIFGMEPQLAVEMPRFASYSFPALYYPYEYTPGELKVESSLCREVGPALSAMGHEVVEWPDRIWRAASVCVTRRDTATGQVWGGADNRRDAYAVGW